MGHTVRAQDPIPRPPMSRPNLGLVGWTLFGLGVAALLIYGFTASRGPSLRLAIPGAALEGTPGFIRTYGSIPELMDGDTGGKVSLSTVPSGPGVVAVGSLSELRGEIVILRGERWLARVDAAGRVVVERGPSSGESAAFLALADVPRWKEQSFDAPVPFERLATELERRAREVGLDLTRPFPLLIEGTLSAVELNVVNGPALGSERISASRLRDTAVKTSLPRAEGSIVGFFAASGGQRLVHAGQRLHLHVVLPSEQRVGHLDSAQLEPGSVLRLPATR
jgi:hypothetical protein